MATAEDAKVIMELYDLRREEVMREARKWIFAEFFPQSVDDIRAVLANPQHSAYFRQAVSYWDMAAAMVNHGCVDAALFYDTNGEYLAVWAKISDLVPELRQGIFGPQYVKNLEKLVQNQPGAQERVEFFKQRFRQLAETRATKAD
jgi:hypothetical protein